MELELLLAHADDHRPVLESGLSADSLRHASFTFEDLLLEALNGRQ